MRILITISLAIPLFVFSAAIAKADDPAVGPKSPDTRTLQEKEPDKCTSYNKSDYKEGNHLGDLGDHWSVGSKATASFFRYNLKTEKASFNERTLGVGLSFRYYTEDQLANANSATSIKKVPTACRARTEDLLDFARKRSDGTWAKVGSWISLSPTLFVSKAETDGDVAIQPALVVGFLNDIISIGTTYNLTGTGRGQWSIIVGPSYGFQW